MYFGVGGLIALATTCGIGGWVFDVVQASLDLDRSVQRARAAGVPWTAADLQPRPAVKGPDNAITEFQMAADKLLAINRGTSNTFLMMLSDTQWKTLQEDIDKKGTVLEDLRLAAKRPAVDFRRDWDLGALLDFPEYSEVKEFTKLLCASAVLKARVHKVREAGEEIAAARKIAWLTAQDPTVMAGLVAASSDTVALNTANHCMAFLADSGADLKSFSDIAFAEPLQFDVLRSLKGDAYLGIATIRNLEKLGGWRKLTGDNLPKSITDPVRSGVPGSIIDRAFMCRHLQYWTAALNIYRAESDHPLVVAEKLDRLTESIGAQKKFSYVVTDVLTPVYGSVVRSNLRMKARWTVQRALATVLDFRARTGHFPESLGECDISPVDPFDSKPLRYRKQGDSVRIWSIGGDGRDEGGQTAWEARKRVTAYKPYDDIVGYFPVPKQNFSVY